MNLLMISGDRSLAAGKRGAFWYTLASFSTHWDRIDILCPRVKGVDELAVSPDALTFFGNVHVHPSPVGLLGQPAWIARKAALLHKVCHFDVVTVHEFPPFYNGRGAQKLLKQLQIGSVLEIHHIVGDPVPASLAERIGKILSRMYLPIEGRSFTAIRTVSKHTAEKLLSWKIDRSKVRVVPSFYLDHRIFAALPSNPQKQYDVAFCARLVRNKGLDRVLRAMAKVPHATLLVIGDGPDRKRCEELAKQLDISERVEFRGWLESQEEVLKALTTAKIFVMNSLSEGGPRIALEAMAAGLPIISTRVGVMTDVIEETKNGLFTTGEPDDLADAVKRLLSDLHLRETLGKNAKGILDRFEREKLIAQYARFLQSCALPKV